VRRERRARLTFVCGENRDGFSGVSGCGRHDEDSDVLLESEVSGVEELEDLATVSGGHDSCPCFTEDVSDNL